MIKLLMNLFFGLYIYSFLFSVTILIYYIHLAKRFDNRVRLKSHNVTVQDGKILMMAGTVFCIYKISALFFIYESEILFGSIFMWFAGHGVFAILFVRIMLGIQKNIREIRAFNGVSQDSR